MGNGSVSAILYQRAKSYCGWCRLADPFLKDVVAKGGENCDLGANRIELDQIRSK